MRKHEENFALKVIPWCVKDLQIPFPFIFESRSFVSCFSVNVLWDYVRYDKICCIVHSLGLSLWMPKRTSDGK